MKKYTVIYTEAWNSGSHRHTITKMLRVQCEHVQYIMNQFCADNCQYVNYIFEGHSLMEGETSINESEILTIEC